MRFYYFNTGKIPSNEAQDVLNLSSILYECVSESESAKSSGILLNVSFQTVKCRQNIHSPARFCRNKPALNNLQMFRECIYSHKKYEEHSPQCRRQYLYKRRKCWSEIMTEEFRNIGKPSEIEGGWGLEELRLSANFHILMTKNRKEMEIPGTFKLCSLLSKIQTLPTGTEKKPGFKSLR